MGTVDQPAQCAGCGQQLPLDHTGPCPSCGTVGKKYNVSIQETLNVRETLGWQHMREYYEKHRVLLPTVVIITVGAPFLGLVLAGWTGVGVGLVVGIATFFLSLRAVTKVREIRQGSEP
jgi:hypothetical protein